MGNHHNSSQHSEPRTLHLASLGCARNQVDSEVMLGKLLGAGWHLTPDPAAAEVIVVNTCSFIESAANESIDTILELAAYKESGRCQRLVVTGCLPERYREEITSALPEVDIFLGTGAFEQVVTAVEAPETLPVCVLPDPDAISDYKHEDRRRFNLAHVAYLKIAEGCSRHCTYCIIPRLRGQQKSRPPEEILAEAGNLIGLGVRELILIAQDTTHYGADLNPRHHLAELLDRLAALDKHVWIRLLYGHPESITDEVIRSMGKHSNICSYLDLPVQHAGDTVLKNMGRHYTGQDLHRLFDRIRREIPNIALRTTVITGFPGETEADFQALMELIDTVRFDHLGVFTYSDADDLPSHRLADHVAPEVGEERRHRLMTAQREISAQLLQARVGRRYAVLIDSPTEDGSGLMGRTAFQAPEVDGQTFIRTSQSLEVGRMIPIRIIEALDYDLVGEPE
jgi:ribosomal protein S12 methylthiotransferase